MTVSLFVNGQNHAGWKDIQINLAMDSLSGTFSLEVSEKWPDGSRDIKAGDACEVRMDGETVITGYVDSVSAGISGDDHTLSVAGRDKAGDLVDCSAVGKPNQWAGAGMATIVKALVAPFKIPVTIATNVGEPFKKFSIEQGESVYEAIKRMADLRAVLVLSDGRGGLIITNRATTRAADSLVCKANNESNNVLSANFTEDFKERFSSITVKGQTQGSSTVDATTASGPRATVTDAAIRYRPLVLMAEGQANTKQCDERAQWELRRRKANSHNLTVTVQGWHQSNGQLWTINTITKVVIPVLKVNEDMLITGVDYSLNEQGTLTTLTLTKPEAYDLIREQEPKE